MLMIDGFSKVISRIKEMKWKNIFVVVFDVSFYFKEDIIVMFFDEGVFLVLGRMVVCY